MLDNVGTIVTSLVSKEQVDRQASDELLQHTFPGSSGESVEQILVNI